MLKQIFFMLFVRPLVLLITGVQVVGKDKLPSDGAYIIAANHNSHLDTMVLISLFPISQIARVRPVAASDYFMKNRWFAWFSQHIIGIIPLKRKPSKEDGHPLSAVIEAINRGDIIIIFPEGSRGTPGEMEGFKRGISHLAKESPSTPIIPIYINGTEKALPKGEALFVPFIINVLIGDPLYYRDETHAIFAKSIEKSIRDLESDFRER